MKMTDLTALLQEKRAATGTGSPLRVVICGEVSAGKSTVMNALMRDQMLPDNIGQSARPVLVAGWREIPGIEASGRDGREIRAALPGTPELFHGADFIRLWLDQPHLSGIELIELPMTRAEELTGAQIDLVQSADVMIWVTIGSQAWRLTEKAIVEALGETRPDRSILIVSRGDKLRSDKDRGRLMERMERETAALFGHRFFLFGDRRKIAASAGSEADWQATGGAPLAALLRGFAGQPDRTVYDREPREKPVETRTAPGFEARFAAETEEDPPFIVEVAKTDETILADAGSDTEVWAPANPGPDTAPVMVDESVSETVAAVEHMPVAAAGADHGTGARVEVQPDPEPVAPVAKTAPPARPGILQAGLLHEDGAGHTLLAGDAETLAQLADFCRVMLTQLQDARLTAEGGPVSFFSLSTAKRRLLIQVRNGAGAVFMLADAAVMNQGMAQMAIGQLGGDRRVTG
ncbi:hypothetical protein M3484_08670 [Pseudomonas sp. GX19020]|uniref:hypothetical protein n=1 Tax=Pseudomonas sp. GX19020 TaxID=2942277 RepID=UPI0020195456|nr:hypothetical protein [Pseudomonas sp. GX19020]MCL4066643.1 hypothetical protein [Pseudomonas sp. GX19020]